MCLIFYGINTLYVLHSLKVMEPLKASYSLNLPPSGRRASVIKPPHPLHSLSITPSGPGLLPANANVFESSAFTENTPAVSSHLSIVFRFLLANSICLYYLVLSSCLVFLYVETLRPRTRRDKQRRGLGEKLS